MEKIVLGIAVAFASINLTAQSPESKQTISFTFAIDGAAAPCDNPKVVLHVDHRPIPVKMIDSGFIVPELFKELYDSPRTQRENNIDIHIGCGEYSFDFPGEYPVRLLPGVWKLGIRYPSTWFEGRSEEPIIEKGTWLSYVDWECNECEPVVESVISHADPPTVFVDRLRREQSGASGEKAMNIAYDLAVFNVDYEKNRNYLLSLLDMCLSSPDKSSVEDVCDDTKLNKFLVNLYWRGDSGLLTMLLQNADSKAYVVEESGDFYGDMLDRRTAVLLQNLSRLPVEKQMAVCRLAGKDDFSINSPKEERVAKQLRAIGGNLAERCLQEAEEAANGVPWRQKKK